MLSLRRVERDGVNLSGRSILLSLTSLDRSRAVGHAVVPADFILAGVLSGGSNAIVLKITDGLNLENLNTRKGQDAKLMLSLYLDAND